MMMLGSLCANGAAAAMLTCSSVSCNTFPEAWDDGLLTAS